MLYVWEHFDANLKRLGLLETVKATYYKIEISVSNLFAIFELYCPALVTFFTSVGELGMALHDMREVSNLPMGSYHIRSIFLAQWNWSSWRRMIRLCSRPIGS